MNDFSLIDKFIILMNIIVSNPLFLICILISIILLIVFITFTILNKKINKWIFIVSWALLGLVIIIRYNSVMLNLVDNLFDSVFMALYFPNLTVYLIMLLISNIFFIYSIIMKNINKAHKITNIVNSLIINLFLIIIIDIVGKNNINVYDQLTIYSNSNLLVLLELNSAVFTSWVLVSLLISAHTKLKKYDKKEYPKMQEMPEIIFD